MTITPKGEQGIITDVLEIRFASGSRGAMNEPVC